MDVVRRPGEAVELAGEALTTWPRCSHPRAVRRRSALTCAAHRSQRGSSGVPHGESRPRCSPVGIVPHLARSRRLADIGARRELGGRSRFHSPIPPRRRLHRSPLCPCCFGHRSPPRRSGRRRRLRSSAPGPVDAENLSRPVHAADRYSLGNDGGPSSSSPSRTTSSTSTTRPGATARSAISLRTNSKSYTHPKPRPRCPQKWSSEWGIGHLERTTGFEPATLTLASRYW